MNVEALEPRASPDSLYVSSRTIPHHMLAAYLALLIAVTNSRLRQPDSNLKWSKQSFSANGVIIPFLLTWTEMLGVKGM